MPGATHIVLMMGDSRGHGLFGSLAVQHHSGDWPGWAEHPASALPPRCPLLRPYLLSHCLALLPQKRGTSLPVTHRHFHRHCRVLQRTLQTLNPSLGCLFGEGGGVVVSHSPSPYRLSSPTHPSLTPTPPPGTPRISACPASPAPLPTSQQCPQGAATAPLTLHLSLMAS